MHELVEAAGNVVFVLIMNSIRELYLEHAAALSAVVADHDDAGAALPARAPGGRGRATRRGAAGAVAALAEAQERRLLEALG